MLNFATLLRLERPLAWLDLETTGFNPDADRILQIALTIHYVSRDPIAWSTLVDPEVNIPPHPADADWVGHGITNEDVQGKPTFKMIAPALAPKITNVDIAGYNVDFDIGFMKAAMKRAGVVWEWAGYVIDPLQIYRRRMPMNLSNAYVEFGGEDGQPLPRGSKLDGAHDAGNDVAASEIVLRGQLRRWQDLPRTVKELSEYCFPRRANAVDKDGKVIWNKEGVACVAFGKHARNGPLPLQRLDRNYMQWILDNDFPADVKDIMRAAMMGVYPVKS